jgi:hypothetical protein
MGGEVQQESLRSHPPTYRSRPEAAAEGMIGVRQNDNIFAEAIRGW